MDGMKRVAIPHILIFALLAFLFWFTLSQHNLHGTLEAQRGKLVVGLVAATLFWLFQFLVAAKEK
jgi:hypothetical protein